jgi:hypothetical protein
LCRNLPRFVSKTPVQLPVDAEYLFQTPDLFADGSLLQLASRWNSECRSAGNYFSQNGEECAKHGRAQRQTGLSFLYPYTPRPNTALYVGYNDLLFNGLDPLDRRRVPGLFRQQRTLFTKLSYNLRF